MTGPESIELLGSLERTADAIASATRRHEPRLRVTEVGVVRSVQAGVARMAGLSSLGADEVVTFASGVSGLAYDLESSEVGIILLGDEESIESGEEVRATGTALAVPVGDSLLGRVVDPMGVPLDDLGSLGPSELRAVEQRAPRIMMRAPVAAPLQTGIKAIDSLVPIGRGQRELILGDRQTGKTAIALDTIANQRDEDVLCVYCAIGQRDASVWRTVKRLEEQGALEHTVVVVASGDDAPGLQYVAPYAAMSMAEHFMLQGRDALIVFDDLTRHARAYRELSLLLRRPPGREGYPGDIFHLHARLLERSTRRKEDFGGGSVTAMPIVETQAQNISGYIPTNLISITDGQLYLSPDLFKKGVLPAIDIGRSVSRVGGDAQQPAYRAVVKALRLSYSQFHELEIFARFASQLDEPTRRALVRGRRVREVLKQPESAMVPVSEQIASLVAVTQGVLDRVPVERIAEAEIRIRSEARRRLPDVLTAIAGGAKLDEHEQGELRRVAEEAVLELVEEEPDDLRP